ncbi:hypothetical protein ACEWPM_019510 [Roseovarius sp. S4756]|uniref:hypothetical protein n=1 Tax=Roseovarius maritimus TaxID=3342637 RepID=UPI00372AAF95
MLTAEITFDDGGRALCAGMDVEFLIPSPQAEGLLARQRLSHEYGPAELGQTDRAVSSPREALDDLAQSLHRFPDDHDVDKLDPEPDKDDFDLSP